MYYLTQLILTNLEEEKKQSPLTFQSLIKYSLERFTF